MSTSSLLLEIDKGREGNNQGISTGLARLDDLIDGIVKGTYTLIFAGSGIGKK